MKKLILMLVVMGIFSVMFAEAPSFQQNLKFNLSRFYAMNSQNSDKIFLEKEKLGNVKNQAKEKFTYISLTPVIAPGLAIGRGKVIYNEENGHCKEFTPYFHINVLPMISTIGIAYIHNYFKNYNRTGYFFRTNVGLEGGLGMGYYPYVIPDLSLGYGYSWKNGKNSYFRISMDVGVKVLISNLNFSYVF